MQNLYEALGLSANASASDIKRSYRNMALTSHPDHGGDAAKMTLLNEAYATLSDPEKRKDFDARWEAYKATDMSEQSSSPILTDYLSAGNIQPYSYAYRLEHNALRAKYAATPLERQESKPSISMFCPIIKTPDKVDVFHKSISPAIAVELLIDCLSGSYHDVSFLNRVKEYLRNQSSHIAATTPKAPELSFYEGIKEIIFMLPKAPDEQVDLICSIKKITDFAKQTSESQLTEIIPLFYHKQFRLLYVHALDLYWHAHEGLFDKEERELFGGYAETKDLLNVFRDRLSQESNEHLTTIVQYISFMFHFEKDIHESTKKAETAEDYREMAFHCLDWLPIFVERSSKPILLNIFLQIGVLFQQASKLETEASVCMADEQLAQKLYLTATMVGHHATPDAEIYASVHAIKYMSAFQFKNEMFDEILEAFKKRTLVITDIFPFFETPQSNVAIFRQESRSLHLMRKLLNVMLAAYEHNKTNSNTIMVDHTVTDILYQAYEACLKSWFQEEYDSETEKKFRLELMEELLLDNGWSSFDVEQLLDSPWVLVDRDEDGWLRPTRSLPFSEDERFTKYRSMNGIEIDHTTGEIQFFMTPWEKQHPSYAQVFTLFDLQDMLERSLSGAIFSLDPVDPDKPFHPFNLMRFSPAELYESELLNTMLLTDYVLKFLTTNQEVQGQYPFEQRPVMQMIAHLPQYLRDIIEEYQQAPHTGALHRFWIEAEEIDVSMSHPTQIENRTRIGLEGMKMVVKKHRMERDIHGNLQDVNHDNDGWPIYVLTPDEVAELQQGMRSITGRAMIFIYRQEKLFYWDNHEVILEYSPKDYRETLIRLFKQPKDENGKVIQNTKNMPLMYRITRVMAERTEQPHHYSPEFIFAHEFTTHYDEFAQYLPEFGRLKELSKISVLVRFLDNIRTHNHESIEAIDAILSQRTPETPSNDTYQNWMRNVEKINQMVTGIFNNTNTDFCVAKLRREHQSSLSAMRAEIGDLDFSSYSSEVDDVCKRYLDDLERANHYRVSRSQLEREVVNPKRSEIARDLSEQKKSSVRSQLRQIFTSQLSITGPTLEGAINDFLRRNYDSITDILVKRNLQKQFPNVSTADIASAMNRDSSAIWRIATQESHRQLREERQSFEKLESNFFKINLGKNKALAEQEETCFWVPASVRHEVKRDENTGLTRYSFFVYGGVSIQPRTNMVAGGGPLRGSSVGSRTFNRNQILKGYQEHHIASDKNRLTRNHELWKLSGMNANSRANKIYLPKTAEQHPTRSVHSGRHTNSYSSNIAKRMDDITERGKNSGWTQAQYREQTRQVLSEVRQDLRSGNIALNKNHRPWAKK